MGTHISSHRKPLPPLYALDTNERNLDSPSIYGFDWHWRAEQDITMSDQEQSSGAGGNQDERPRPEHLKIKVTDNNNNEVFLRMERPTAFAKLVNAFCGIQGKSSRGTRFVT